MINETKSFIRKCVCIYLCFVHLSVGLPLAALQSNHFSAYPSLFLTDFLTC